ncbi:MAG TPA: RNA polymerase sigma factor [Terriglobales bacterium]|nr:RNA polymerase sigma factor [Terriglobales bacterium]
MPVLEQQSDLLQQFAAGDIGAFETLFREHQAEVFRWIVRIVRDSGAAEDLTIETFWRIHKAHARFDPERNFAAWARRIATNAALDYLKSRRREVPLSEDTAAAEPCDSAIRRDIREKTQRAFCKLPPKLRVVAALALIDEQPYAEIADALDISVGAVKLRVLRALRRLRKHLKQMGIEP